MKNRTVALRTTAVFVAFFAYFAWFRRYGFQLEDEGTLLFQLDRVTRGQFPYRDFGTGYTPGYFYAGAILLDLLGHSAVALRTVLAVLGALNATLIYTLSRRVAGEMLALIPALLWVAFIPVYAGEFAAFNVPYPAWFVIPFWFALAYALLAWQDTAESYWLVAAGVAVSAAFAIKPNAGAFAAAASVWVVCFLTVPRGRIDAALGALGALVVAGGVWFAFGLRTWGSDAAVHLLPLLALVAVYGRPGRGIGPDERGTPEGTVGRMFTLFAGFVPLTLLWAIPTSLILGAERFARDVLLIGSNAADLYWVSQPLLETVAALIVAIAVALVVLSKLIAAGKVAPLPVVGLGTFAAVLGGAVLATSAVMPEGATTAVVQQLENASFWLLPIVHWCVFALLLGALVRPRRSATERALIVLVPLAIAMYWQLFPRSDFMHVVFSAPLSAVLACVLLAEALRLWAIGDWPRNFAAGAILPILAWTAVGMLVLLKTVPGLQAAAACDSAVDGAPDRLSVCVEPQAEDELENFARTAAFVAARTEPHEPVLVFPALGGLLYAIDRSSPASHDYWYPGRPDHEEERALVAHLERQPTRYVVAQNSDWWVLFVDSPFYYATLRSFVNDNYRPVARFGRYDVLARNELAGGELVTVETPGRTAAISAPPIEPVAARRRQLVHRWLAHVEPPAAGAALLSDDTAEAVLQLRGLRDAGDLRAAGWLIEGLRRPEIRVQREARGAMLLITRRFLATTAAWGGGFRAADYLAWVAPHWPRALPSLSDPAIDARAFAYTLLWIVEHPDATGADTAGLWTSRWVLSLRAAR